MARTRGIKNELTNKQQEQATAIRFEFYGLMRESKV
jgi:hypothetical protein